MESNHRTNPKRRMMDPMPNGVPRFWFAMDVQLRLWLRVWFFVVEVQLRLWPRLRPIGKGKGKGRVRFLTRALFIFSFREDSPLFFAIGWAAVWKMFRWNVSVREFGASPPWSVVEVLKNLENNRRMRRGIKSRDLVEAIWNMIWRCFPDN